MLLVCNFGIGSGALHISILLPNSMFALKLEIQIHNKAFMKFISQIAYHGFGSVWLRLAIHSHSPICGFTH